MLKRAKTCLCLFIVAFTIFANGFYTFSARAESTTYMRVIDSVTPFFADEDATDLLFYLPYTYYVKILSVDGNVAHIEYGNTSIDGYTYYDKLFKDGLEVSAPFPDLTLKTHKTAVLYKDQAASNPILYVFAERNLTYFGSIKNADGYLYFVEYNGNLGYVKEECLYPFSVPQNDNPLTFLPEEEEEESTDSGKQSVLTPFRIIIISCLLLAGIIAVIYSVKRKKPPYEKGDYYEENDYE